MSLFRALVMRLAGIRSQVVQYPPSTPKITRLTYPAKRQALVDGAIARAEADAWRKGQPVEVTRSEGQIVVERPGYRTEWRVRP